MGLIKKIKDYILAVINEMKKISWTSKRELFNTTVLIIILSFILSLFVGFWDFVFARILRLIVR